MKKLLTILSIMLLAVTVSAQKPIAVFGHTENIAPKLAQRGLLDNTQTVFSFDAVVTGAQVTFNNEDKYFKTSALSGAGFAIGIKKFKTNADSTITTTFGASVAVMTSVRLDEVVQTKMQIALLAHVYNLTAGPVYIIGDNKFGLLVGAALKF